jgi:penicillin-binding protein 2
MFGRNDKKGGLGLEESLEYGWVATESTQEVAVPQGAFFVLGAIALAVIGTVVVRVFFLGAGTTGSEARAQATANVERATLIAAPRGVIRDRYGVPIAENVPSFSVLVDLQAFLKNKALEDQTIATLQQVLGLNPDDVYAAIKQYTATGHTDPLVIYRGLSDQQTIALKSANVSTLLVREGYQREYPDGPAFATVLGYTGLPTNTDLKQNRSLRSDSVIGKSGIEAQYDDALRGTPGKTIEVYDAHGQPLQEERKVDPQPGADLQLTVDAGFQQYFYDRLGEGLRSLGRTGAAGIALDPRTGEVLALVSMPSYDNNVFIGSSATSSAARQQLVSDPSRPLYDRAVSGEYSPGSTIKPLVATAALAEHVVDPSWSIFSPGYLDIPNPYDPAHPTRYLDWRYQGTINVRSAIAQSSDVYFYAVGGGIAGQLQGLGISRLISWWEKFHLGQKTGIDLPGEQTGFLPSPAWKEKRTNEPWRLGDTYNVSIGQGDLQLTPIQLAMYTAGMANGGTLYRPFIAAAQKPNVITTVNVDPSVYTEVQKGMRLTVTSPMGTAYTMNDLPFPVAAKTGSAQIQNNTKENAFFIGYAPYNDPQIALVLLVEEAKEGSLNAVPIAKDILNWYYQNRIKMNTAAAGAQVKKP